jgi:hypothetical protein
LPIGLETADTTGLNDAGLHPGQPNTAHVSVLDHVLERLPVEIRASLSEAQLAALSAAMMMPSAVHLLDYRISVRWLRRRYYVRLLTGHERRSLSRLQREKQISLGPSIFLIAAVTWVLVSAAIILAVALVYFVKSAFGFDMLDGESVLHACFFG